MIIIKGGADELETSFSAPSSLLAPTPGYYFDSKEIKRHGGTRQDQFKNAGILSDIFRAVKNSMLLTALLHMWVFNFFRVVKLRYQQ